MSDILRSVGLDVGTTSTQMIFSELTVENKASGFAVPEMEIARRDIRYRSPVYFTPLLDESHVDAGALRELVAEEYRKAGIRRESVDTGAIIITGETSRKENARAVLDAIAFQVTDLVQAMNADAPCPITTLRVDGGASVSDIMMQTQADLLRLPVDRPAQVETTAFGAAALAGLAAGVWGSLEEVAALRRSQHVFLPQRPQAACEAQYRLWRRAVDRALRWIENDV